MPQLVKYPGPSNIYREQLSSLYHGIALWKPNPVEDIYNQVSIGDVGYISSKGNFIRMFNVTLPWDDPSNRRLAQPEPYDPITIASIARENFGQVDYYSLHVSREENAGNRQVATHEQARGVTYTCQGPGALLSLPCGGYREDAVHERMFQECIRNNVDSWSNWSRNVGLPVDRMDDLIFITGCTLVTSYASAVLDGRIADAEISLVSSSLNNGGASFVWSNIRGTIEHHDSQLNPNIPSAPRNRCVFIRGFRAKRVLFWNKPIRAAAEPHPEDPDDPDDNGMEDIQVNEVPYIPKYLDPLNGVLDYIAEKCLEAGDAEGALAIVHDDDLQIIKSIDLETLTAHAVLKFLHENKIPVLIENGVATLQGDNTRNQSRGNQVPQVQDSQLEATLLGIDEEKREYARRLFQCLAVSIRPPRVEELAEIIAFQFPKAAPSVYNATWRPENAEEAVLSACPSLISIVDREGHRVVQFSNLSIKDYLTSERLRTAEERLSYFHILPEPAHTILAHPRISYLAPSTSSFQSTERISQGAVSSESQRQSPYTSIYFFNDDLLLYLFFSYRSLLLNEYQDVSTHFRGEMPWVGERWWYRLAHVCRRWRHIIHQAPFYLGLCLVCTYGTPVVDMLCHSPLLPLVIDYEGTDITAEDEEEIALALVQRDRVRRIRFILPVRQLQKLVKAIDGEYPILECLILVESVDPFEDKSTVLNLPKTLQIPYLRHLAINYPIPIRFPLLTTAMDLVTLHLALHHPSTYFQPTVLLRWLSLMPQLEMLLIHFYFVFPDRKVESQFMPTPIVTPITLPNLRLFAFHVISAYSEAVLSRITAPRLENFQISYPQQLIFFVPQLLQFMERTKNFEFYRAYFNFSGEKVCVQVNGPETNMTVPSFSINVNCWHLDWQLSSVADIFDMPSQIFSSVKHLTLAHQVHSRSSDNEADPIDWWRLLRSFSNVKTLHIGDGLVRELSRCLPLEDGEQPLGLLPELQELTYSASSNADDAFTPFIDARQNAGRPVTLIKSQIEGIEAVCALSQTDKQASMPVYPPYSYSASIGSSRSRLLTARMLALSSSRLSPSRWAFHDVKHPPPI